MRLQKFLADCGLASRRAAEKLITSGKVKVNGQIVAELGTKVDPAKDKVEYNGRAVSSRSRRVYIILNKPAGYLSACSAKKGEKTVLDLVKVPERIFPVGRLDKDSEGLLILTNDGGLAHKLMHPSFEHEKEYVVLVREKLSPHQINHLRNGVLLEDGKTCPARVRPLGPKEFSITIHEGRNRQIRRMCAALNLTVVRLRRVRVGQLKLGSLGVGKWKFIKAESIF
jgi:pseudouridine synthase